MRKNLAPKQIELSHERTLVGRHASNDIQIDHPSVSRHHLELLLDDGNMWLIDLGSLNGTRVNGRRVKQLALQHGDVVSVGDCDIRFLTRHTNFELPKELALAGLSNADTFQPARAPLPEREFLRDSEHAGLDAGTANGSRERQRRASTMLDLL